MKIFCVHNFYQQSGGEDAVFAAELALLRAHGHRVTTFSRSNDDLKGQSIAGRLFVSGFETIWSFNSYKKIKQLLADEKPDIAHFHNTFPLISPSAYYACEDARVPVVQTLHNYRLLCPAATLLRDGRICESCVGRRVSWPGVVHACYRDSRAATAAVSGMLASHRAVRTWNQRVDIYVALSEFAREKFIQGGLPRERMVVKPNFVHDPGVATSVGDCGLYVGRLSEEKGISVLFSAWSKLTSSVPLQIAGVGPMQEKAVVEIERRGLGQVKLLGHLQPDQVLEVMRGARFLIFPSVWFEGFPMVIAEAFACGVPVIASRLGAMQEIVEDGQTGLHFSPGDAQDLATKIEWAWSHPDVMREMGNSARREYEAKYTPEHNYRALMDIYERVVRVAR
ncbi:MAG: glycosyltransferase family 4 protein [Terriglobales bacterium]